MEIEIPGGDEEGEGGGEGGGDMRPESASEPGGEGGGEGGGGGSAACHDVPGREEKPTRADRAKPSLRPCASARSGSGEDEAEDCGE